MLLSELQYIYILYSLSIMKEIEECANKILIILRITFMHANFFSSVFAILIPLVVLYVVSIALYRESEYFKFIQTT